MPGRSFTFVLVSMLKYLPCRLLTIRLSWRAHFGVQAAGCFWSGRNRTIALIGRLQSGSASLFLSHPLSCPGCGPASSRDALAAIQGQSPKKKRKTVKTPKPWPENPLTRPASKPVKAQQGKANPRARLRIPFGLQEAKRLLRVSCARLPEAKP